MAWFAADFHIHSCLSPCGDLSASPRSIVQAALGAKIDLVALTDHNSSLNCPALAFHAHKMGLNAFYGLEATSAEEVHALCLFETLGQAMDFSSLAYAALANIPNDPEAFGDQIYVDEHEDIDGEVEKLLIGALSYSLTELELAVHQRGGLFVPAHVDRSAFSCLSQLGYVPPGHYDALEICKNACQLSDLRYPPLTTRRGYLAPMTQPCALDANMFAQLTQRLGQDKLVPSQAWHQAFIDGNPLPQALSASSDAHYPADIGQRRTLFWADRPDFAGLRLAMTKGWTVPCWSPRLDRIAH